MSLPRVNPLPSLDLGPDGEDGPGNLARKRNPSSSDDNRSFTDRTQVALEKKLQDEDFFSCEETQKLCSHLQSCLELQKHYCGLAVVGEDLTGPDLERVHKQRERITEDFFRLSNAAKNHQKRMRQRYEKKVCLLKQKVKFLTKCKQYTPIIYTCIGTCIFLFTVIGFAMVTHHVALGVGVLLCSMIVGVIGKIANSVQKKRKGVLEEKKSTVNVVIKNLDKFGDEIFKLEEEMKSMMQNVKAAEEIKSMGVKSSKGKSILE